MAAKVQLFFETAPFILKNKLLSLRPLSPNGQEIQFSLFRALAGMRYRLASLDVEVQVHTGAGIIWAQRLMMSLALAKPASQTLLSVFPS